MNRYGETITIEVVSGGFILSVPDVKTGEMTREVLSSPRKLITRVKDVVSELGLVPADAE